MATRRSHKSKKSQRRKIKWKSLWCQTVLLVIIFCIGSRYSMYFNNFWERKFVFWDRHAKKLVKVAPWILVSYLYHLVAAKSTEFEILEGDKKTKGLDGTVPVLGSSWKWQKSKVHTISDRYGMSKKIQLRIF